MRVLAAVLPSIVFAALLAAPAARGQAVLLAGSAGGDPDGLLGSVSVADATWTTIGDPTSLGDLQGLALNSVGDLYGTNLQDEEGHFLLLIDEDTGELQATIGELRDVTDEGSLQMSDIAFRPATGELYGLISFPPSQQGELCLIDVTTGGCTILGDTGLEPGGMAFAPDGTLWVATTSKNPVLAEIDPDTAAVIGTPVVLTVAVDALAVRSDGTIFGKEFGTRSLFTLDPADGSISVIGDIPTPSDGVGALVFMEPTFTEVGAHFLPRTVRVKLNESKPEKSSLVATGFLDLGPDPVDLSLAATLDVGGYSVSVPSLEPNKQGTSFKLKQAGLLFQVTPDKSGSSRAKFTLKVKDDLAGLVDPESELVLHFVNAAVDATGTVTLEQGRYTLGRKRGALIEPAIHLYQVRGTLKGDGQDALTLKVGLATKGITPAGAPTVELDFAAFEATVPASSFVKKGDRFLFKGEAGGVTSVVLDYLRETVTVKAKGVELGELVEGPVSLSVTLRVGLDVREVTVRMVRKAKSLKY